MNIFETNFLITVIPFSLLVLCNFHYTTATDSSVLFPIFKVLPLIWLSLVVKYVNQFIGSNNQNKSEDKKYVTNGLIAAIVGDICLVWPKNTLCLSVGILAFSLTHYSYATSLGFRPIAVKVFLIYCLPMASINLFFISGHLQGIFVVIVPLYSLVISVMLWRALVNYQLKPSQSSVYGLTGAILFVISDGILGIELFSNPDLLSPEIFRFLVMSTYYFSQIMFVLSLNANNRVVGRRVSHRVLKKLKF